MKKLLLGADILMAGIFAWRFMYMPDQIPLLYSRPWGDPQLVEFWYILVLPVLMHLFYFFNEFIANIFFKEDELFHKLFKVANIFLVVTFTGIFLKILFLVT